MARHIDTVAILFFVYALFQLSTLCMVGGIYGLMAGGMVTVGIVEQEMEMAAVGGVFMVFTVFICVMMLLQPVLGFFAAVGLRRRTQVGRVLGIIVCALALMNIPIGTIVGIFGFIVLVDKEAAAEFTAEGREEYFT